MTSTPAQRRAQRAERYNQRVLTDGRLIHPWSIHNASTYVNYGCRCEVCASDHATLRDKRREKTRANGGVAPTANHNENTYANWGCRCDECLRAHAAKARLRRGRLRDQGAA